MNCPHHGDLTLIRETSRYGDLWVCPNHSCSYAVSASQPEPATMTGIASICHGDTPEPAGDCVDAVERLLVARIKAKLEADGYQVLRVGQQKAKGSGTDVGYPDLSVRRNDASSDGRPAWPRGMAALLEVKTATGRVRKRQQELHDDGWSFIIRSTEEAEAALATLEARK